MKANELMIGDWVHYSMNLGKDGIYEKDIQISNLYGFEVNCDIRDYTIIGGHRMSNLSPIPLTAEILEKNGFDYIEKEETCATEAYHEWKVKGKCFHLEDDSWYMKLENRTFRVRFGIAKMNYVHELQHALRLCRLTELADNFKVE